MTNPDILVAALGRLPMAMMAGFMVLSLLASTQTRRKDRPDAAVRSMITQAVRELKRWLGTLRRDAVLTRQVIERITVPHLDLTHMARYTLGSYWQNATPAQRDRFTRALRAHLLEIVSQSMEKHAATIDQLSRADRIHLELRRYNSEQGTALVRLVAVAPKLGWLHVELHLHDHDGSWQIYEISSSGTNLLIGIRSDIQAQLRRDDLEAVIRRLESRTGLRLLSHTPSVRDSQRH